MVSTAQVGSIQQSRNGQFGATVEWSGVAQS